MEKERLTLENIKKDLTQVLCCQMSNKADWRMSYIVPITALAILLGVLLKNIFVGLLIFSIAGYQIFCYVVETKDFKAKKKAVLSIIERGDISISTEILSHISEETIYEPHSRGKSRHSTKTISVYYFDSRASWRVPEISRHYEWSKNYYISTKGLANISVKGNEFFFIHLQGHFNVSYIYPCKNFDLDSSLKK